VLLRQIFPLLPSILEDKMKERLTNCPLCKSGLFLNHAEITDYSISGEKFLLCKCSDCKLIFTNPRPDQENIAPYYQSDNYISHQDKTNNFVNKIYKAVRFFTIRKKVSWINKYSESTGKILDVGCGTGYFLAEAKKAGWITTGIEPNETARCNAEQKNLIVYSNLEQISLEEKFNIITLFHVLEHIHDLRKTTKKLIKLLDKEGLLFIAVPNYHSYDSTHYGEHWASLDVPRHLYHFTPESIQKLAKIFDLEIVKQEPMVFDSYYVSMLSEQYRSATGLKAYLSALKIGFRSNWKARSNKNYSSILFILKKK
jgi:2-polyprenyl-3-methyl-5-hydroxy-6-metoxy-1,4-benzoquinol methylase